MLQRFNERARRVIFFARYEASEYGSPIIEPTHILLGLAREDPALLQHLGVSSAKVRVIHEQLFPEAHERIATSVEVPLSAEATRVLNRAASEADRLGHKHITTGHVLLGILAESPLLRAELGKAGLKEESILSRVGETGEGKSGFDSRSTAISEQSNATVCSGIGYDLHRLEAGRKLMIGGIEIPFDKGPVGHSDGDVLVHAICDALLGAAGMGDIGTHFPDTDPKWKGANSLVFLKHIRKVFAEGRAFISHIDAVVIAERPKLGPHFPAMQTALADALGIEPDKINLKAKTNEGVDAIGRGEAIAAHAVATILV